MEHGFLLLTLAGLGALFMAFNNGANDVANSFASAVGAKAISMKQAVLIAGLMNLLGAVLIGGDVSAKLITGVLNPEQFGETNAYVLAMFSVLLAAGGFVLISTLTRLPVSSSHAIVGSLLGVSVVAGGMGTVNWGEVSAIVISWFLSPVLAGVMSYAMLTFIHRVILGEDSRLMDRLRFWLPYVLSVTLAIFVLILMKGSVLSALQARRSLGVRAVSRVLMPYGVLVSQGLLRTFTMKMKDSRQSAELIFRRPANWNFELRGIRARANDVANAISPVFAIYLVAQSGGLPRRRSSPARGSRCGSSSWAALESRQASDCWDTESSRR